jgi:4-hydroxybenzoate polyprenyltransferase/phosphoglycolate phosphatase-like HAD superfamily hydrolase
MPVLVVDLDGTLIQSDMLAETFWATLAEDVRAFSGAVRALGQGKAALKAYLAGRMRFDPAILPYDQRVIARLRAWREAGGRTGLVTASDERIATRIAAHLELFDDVAGSDPGRNLRGEAKAAHLREAYGRGGYIYLGDAARDLPAWRDAAEAVSVGASPRTRAALDALSPAVTHLPAPSDRRQALWAALRPRQWLKNLLVFVPMLADQQFTLTALWGSLLAFVALSLVASAGYVLNDLLDLADDRTHPRKRLRPIASGALSALTATALAPALLAAGLVIALVATPLLAGVVLLYFAATLAYSIKLKQHTMVDICMLATLFTLRIIAGGVAIDVQLSVWLLAFSMFLFFSLAAVKRLAELTDTEAAGRAVTRRGYRDEDKGVLSQMAITSGYLAVLVLALYIDAPFVRENFASPWLLWAVCPLLIFWVSRMVMIADRGEMQDDPMVFALHNRTSRKVIVLSLLFVLGAIAL